MNAEENLQQLSIALHHTTTTSSSPSSSSSSLSHLRLLDAHRDVTSRPSVLLFRVVAPFLFLFFTVLGFAGNALVVYVIGSRPQMRTVTNLLLLNLAVADLCFVLIVPPLTAYDYAAPAWTLGDALCRATHYVINVTAYVSVYTLVIISVVRYLTVVHNAATLRFRTRRNVTAVVMVTWTTMLVVNVPIVTSYSVARSRCNAVTEAAAQRIFTTFFVFAYVVPLSAIAVLSACILRHIALHRPGPVFALRSRSDSRKRQASRLLVVVVLAFVLLWMPMHLLLLYRHYFSASIPDSAIYDVVAVVIQCLPYVNSCVNPFIYSHSSKDFRDAFREVVSCPRSSSSGSSCEPPVEAPGPGKPRQGAHRSRLAVPGVPFVELGEDGAFGARRVTDEHEGNETVLMLTPISQR